jgi:hypothetical protein
LKSRPNFSSGNFPCLGISVKNYSHKVKDFWGSTGSKIILSLNFSAACREVYYGPCLPVTQASGRHSRTPHDLLSPHYVKNTISSYTRYCLYEVDGRL